MRHLYKQRPVELFEQDLNYIRKEFQPVTYDELTDQLEFGMGRNPSKKLALHLSFDDGFVECFDIVRPLLLEYRIPCTFFIATDFIDNTAMYYRNKVSLLISAVNTAGESPSTSTRKKLKTQLAALSQEFGTRLLTPKDFVQWINTLTGEGVIDRICEILELDFTEYLKTHKPYMTREQLRILSDEGFTIGAHSRRHQKLVRLTPDEMEDEIVASCQAIAAITGRFSIPFSFPNSGDGVDRNFLADLRLRYPQVGLIFDTKGLRQDRSFIFNRIWAESPLLNPDGRRTLSEILHRVYLNDFTGTK